MHREVVVNTSAGEIYTGSRIDFDEMRSSYRIKKRSELLWNNNGYFILIFIQRKIDLIVIFPFGVEGLRDLHNTVDNLTIPKMS